MKEETGRVASKEEMCKLTRHPEDPSVRNDVGDGDQKLSQVRIAACEVMTPRLSCEIDMVSGSPNTIK